MSDFSERFEDRYPEHRAILIQLCKEEEIRELCDHYAECRQILRRLLSMSSPDRCRVREYEEMVRDLEEEIEEIVEASSRNEDLERSENK